MHQSYFFDDGLQFECTGCGACCTGEPGQVLVSPTECDALAGHFGLSVEDFVATYCRSPSDGLSLIEMTNGDCVFFANNRCTVYELRPRQCRTFPFWLKTLRSRENWTEAAKLCPGIGQGRRYAREEILALVREDIDRRG